MSSTTAAVSALPTRCVALRSKHGNSISYLRSVHDESHGGSVVELGGGDGDGGIMNPRCRFYLEPSEEHEGLMHIRCCYNNKYWVPQQRELRGSARWVVGTADEPEEDLSKPSCTLHTQILVAAGEEEEEEEGRYTCSFLHPQLGKYACGVSSGSVTTSRRPYLHVGVGGDAQHEEKEDQAAAAAASAHDDGDEGPIIDVFTVIDVSRQMLLPSYLAFKGDNGDFLGGIVADRQNYLQFSVEDVGDPKVFHTSFTNDHGVVRIKSNYFDRYWRHSSAKNNWVWADSNDTTYNNRDTLFRVITGDDFVAFQNIGNNLFCRRLAAEDKTRCLSASIGSITNEARIQCYEPVISREIYNVDFRLSEAKKYTKYIDGLYSQTAKNETSTTSKTSLTFTYTSTVDTTWSSTVSLKIGVKTKLQSRIPFFVKGEIEMSSEFSGSYNWGKTQSEQKQTSKSYDVEVPPMKKVTVNAIGSNGACNIPFSYTQKDVLANGQVVIKEFTDGMYYGVKTSDVTFHSIEEELYS